MEKFLKNSLIARFLLGFCALLFFIPIANAEPPTRVIRLAYIDGSVSLSPASEDQWAYASLNRPLITGDRLWSDVDGLAELQLDTAAVRISVNTSLNIINLDDITAQFQLAQGTLNLSIRAIKSNQTYEVDTPNLAFIAQQSGNYRIDVNADGSTTTISVIEGAAEIYGENSSYVINANQTCNFQGTDLKNYRCSNLKKPDEFDNWSLSRDQRLANTKSTEYVSPEIIGYEDLDTYGSWKTIEGYDNAWVPANVARDWAPYRNGHWEWIDPWGWTWVADEPWGFATFHYGRWIYVNGIWAWIPGPLEAAPVYAPALVVFIEGDAVGPSTQQGPDIIGWLPLGPTDIYIPPYAVSSDYFININISNARVNNILVANVYSNPTMKLNYQYRTLTNAITAVPTTMFAQAQPANKAMIPVSKEILSKTSISPVAAVIPDEMSVLGGRIARIKPSETVLLRSTVAKNPPPALPPSFATQRAKLLENPGIPLDAKTIETLTPTTQPSATRFKVVQPTTIKPSAKLVISKPEAPEPIAPRIQALKPTAPLQPAEVSQQPNKMPAALPPSPSKQPRPPTSLPKIPKIMTAPTNTGTQGMPSISQPSISQPNISQPRPQIEKSIPSTQPVLEHTPAPTPAKEPLLPSQPHTSEPDMTSVTPAQIKQQRESISTPPEEKSISKKIQPSLPLSPSEEKGLTPAKSAIEYESSEEENISEATPAPLPLRPSRAKGVKSGKSLIEYESAPKLQFKEQAPRLNKETSGQITPSTPQPLPKPEMRYPQIEHRINQAPAAIPREEVKEQPTNEIKMPNLRAPEKNLQKREFIEKRFE